MCRYCPVVGITTKMGSAKFFDYLLLVITNNLLEIILINTDTMRNYNMQQILFQL